jgi:aminoglycoside/choline kinase family phosphotransferase
MNEAELIARTGQLLGRDDRHWNLATVLVTALVPDGSSRRFFRLLSPDGESLLAVLPPADDPSGPAEARAFQWIGRHLQACGAPVPAILGADAVSGLTLCEDLGDRRLFEEVAEQGAAACRPLYEQAVRGLARMQVRGARGFDPAWCWDTPRYDRQLMQERESGYFLRACCTDLLGVRFDREAVAVECVALSEAAAAAPNDFFLHRDCQSRNIMVRAGRARFIDFQGGRLGPLAYDLAALLLDPYAGLPAGLQEHLTQVYLDELNREIPYDRKQFQREYLLLALQRNLQILGAFAFLSQVRGKPFFARYLRPALASLAGLLDTPGGAAYPALRTLTEHCRLELERRS